MQLVYWLVTHRVNSVWLEKTSLGAGGSRFFAAGAPPRTADWRHLRDRWERSHVVRAILSLLALVALTIAVIRS
jgi:hypothetical protein